MSGFLVQTRTIILVFILVFILAFYPGSLSWFFILVSRGPAASQRAWLLIRGARHGAGNALNLWFAQRFPTMPTSSHFPAAVKCPGSITLTFWSAVGQPNPDIYPGVFIMVYHPGLLSWLFILRSLLKDPLRVVGP